MTGFNNTTIKPRKKYKRVVRKGTENTETPIEVNPAPKSVDYKYFDKDNIYSDGSEFDDDEYRE